jgi:hypothetical protein
MHGPADDPSLVSPSDPFVAKNKYSASQQIECKPVVLVSLVCFIIIH